MMCSYDAWKLASPYGDEQDMEAIADFYDVEEADVTDKMLCDYELDKRERDLTRDL